MDGTTVTDGKSWRIGVVGCGVHSRRHILTSLGQINGARVAAIYDNEPQNLAAAQTLVPDAAVGADGESICGRDDIDAVVVVGPPRLHFRLAMLAIANRKHVFVEKPPTTTTSELDKLARAAREAAVVTCVGHNLRHATAVRIVRQVISDSGERPLFVSVHYSASATFEGRWGIESSRRSLMLSHGIHAVDLLTSIVGTSTLKAVEERRGDGGALTIACLLSCDGGAIGDVVVNTGARRFALEAKVICSGGTSIRLDGLDRVSVQRRQHGARWSEMWRQKVLASGYRHTGYLAELESFLSAIRGNGSSAPSFEDELLTYRVIDAIDAMAPAEEPAS